jgi:hypothetical protein
LQCKFVGYMYIHVFLCFHLSFVVLFCFLFGCTSFQLKCFWSFLLVFHENLTARISLCIVVWTFYNFLLQQAAGWSLYSMWHLQRNVCILGICCWNRKLCRDSYGIIIFIFLAPIIHTFTHLPTHCKLLLNSQIKVNCQISCTLPNHAFSVPAIYLWKNFQLENEEALRRTEAFRNPIQIYSVSNHELGGGGQDSGITTINILSWLKMPVCNRTAAHKNLPNALSCDTAAFIQKAHN